MPYVEPNASKFIQVITDLAENIPLNVTLLEVFV